jgi:hypothetical protein
MNAGVKPAAVKRYNCKIRNHKWDRAPGPGAVCELCTKAWVGVRRGPRGRQLQAAPSPSAVVAPSAAPSAPMGKVIDLSKACERWGLGPAAAKELPGQQAVPAAARPEGAAVGQPAAAPEKPAENTTVSMGNLAEWLGEPLAEFMVELARRRVEKKGFHPNAPDPDWEEKLQECVSKFLAEKLPKIEMKPFTGALLAWAAVYVSMRWRAKPLDDAERAELVELRAFKAKATVGSPSQAGSSPSPSSGPGAAPADHANTKATAGDTDSLGPMGSPGYSLPIDCSWLMGDAGSATAAAPSASAA